MEPAHRPFLYHSVALFITCSDYLEGQCLLCFLVSTVCCDLMGSVGVQTSCGFSVGSLHGVFAHASFPHNSPLFQACA